MSKISEPPTGTLGIYTLAHVGDGFHDEASEAIEAAWYEAQRVRVHFYFVFQGHQYVVSPSESYAQCFDRIMSRKALHDYYDMFGRRVQ